jgi:hypothetical protein
LIEFLIDLKEVNFFPLEIVIKIHSASHLISRVGNFTDPSVGQSIGQSKSPNQVQGGRRWGVYWPIFGHFNMTFV